MKGVFMKRAFCAVRNYVKKTDKLFWLFTITASIYGFMLIYSQQRSGETNFLKTQLMAVGIGYIAAVFISCIDYRFYGKIWWIFAGLALSLTILVFFIGIQITGTDDVGWIKIGSMTFQPSELTKICFIITFAKHLSILVKYDKLKTFFGVLTLVLHAVIPILLIHMQGDDGTALVFGCMFLVMTFAAGVQLRYFIAFFATLFIAAPLFYTKVMNDDQRNRLLVLFDLDDNSLTTYGWQQYQGKVSIASGGLLGEGYMNGSRVERNIVPYQENDFIFTVAGEEFGFIGCIALLLILLLIVIKVIRNAHLADDMFGKMICYGFFSIVASQAIINIGMVLGLLPVVGITLPFFSSGGTSVMCLYLGVGLVQSVYMHRENTASLNKIHNHQLNSLSAESI